MRSDARQGLSHLRVKIALAFALAASTLVAAPSPAPQTPLMDLQQRLASMEPLTPSVAPMPVVETTPASGSAEPAEVAAPTDKGGARAAISRTVEHVKVTAQRLAHPRMSAASLCLSPSSDPVCQAAFDTALRSELETADVVVTASGSAEVVGPRGAQPLHFQKHAPWVRRLETLGKEGIPFVRIPRGPDRELVVGINRKGVLGFSLKQKAEN